MFRDSEKQKIKIKPARRLSEALVVVFFCLMSGYTLSSCSGQKEAANETVNPTVHSGDEIVKAMAEKMAGADFSTFKHDAPEHGKLACALCHERSENSTTLKRAGHIPCASCHVQQFEDKSNAICTICHTEPVTAAVKEFPPLKSFKVKFDHQAHFKETNCATCHIRQGGGMSVPSGADAHASCFQCHTLDKKAGDKNIGSCSTCHEAGTPERIADSTKNIGFNFDHGKHGKVTCSSCHSDAGGNQMTAPTVAMHVSSGKGQSCATCHNGSKAFGANNFSDCRRCHQQFAGTKSFGVRFEHSDHLKANCATCHKSAGKGVTFSVPAGQTAHNTCFQCHSPTKQGTSPDNGYCFACHQPGNSEKISQPSSVIAGNFSHTKHKGLNCNSCHNSGRDQMSAPTVAMHKASKGQLTCASCHNNQKAFGGDDFSNCKRCHTGDNFKF